MKNIARLLLVSVLISACSIMYPRSHKQNNVVVPKQNMTAAPAQDGTVRKSVWESRDPGVVLAEGMVQGTSDYTITFLLSWQKRFDSYFQQHPEKKMRHLGLLLTFSSKLLKLQEATLALMNDPGYKKTITPDDPKFKKFYESDRAANIVFLDLLHAINGE